MNIAVCDNDFEIANDVKNLIVRQKPKATVKVFSSAKDLLLCKDSFEIYFLDIKGISGMELAEKIREKSKSIIVFITGFSEYMPKAFDVNAFHYLLKPLDTEKFKEVLDKATKMLDENYVLLKIQGRNKKVPLKNIFYAESFNKKILFHTTEGVLEVQGKMENFENILEGEFYRCHRCYLVNFSQISSYGKNEIEVLNGDKILLAYKKYSAFVKAYLAYAKRGGVVNV